MKAIYSSGRRSEPGSNGDPEITMWGLTSRRTAFQRTITILIVKRLRVQPLELKGALNF